MSNSNPTPLDLTPIERLALGSNCHACGATADEPCAAPISRKEVRPHQARVDRAVALHVGNR